MNPNRKSLKAAKLAQDVKLAIAEVGRGARGEGLTVLGAVRAQITHAARVQWDALINRRDVFPSTPTAALPSSEPVYDIEAHPIQGNHVSLGNIVGVPGEPVGEGLPSGGMFYDDADVLESKLA